MIDYIYRFRPTSALFGKYQELEKQEIYFAHPSELNDPLDGTKDVFWKGDEILWSNLLCHYVLVLSRALTLASIDITNAAVLDELPVFATEETLPSDGARTLYRKAKLKFFQDTSISKLPAALAARESPVRKSELRMHLRTVHFHALDSTLSAMEELGLTKPRPTNTISSNSEITATCRLLVELLNAQEKSNPDKLLPAEVIGDASEAIVTQQSLFLAVHEISFANGPAWQAIVSDFPSRYLVALESLLYSEWYTACFVEEPTNAAMWGHYAASHSGVALKFKTSSRNTNPALRLNNISGYSRAKGDEPSPVRTDILLELSQVKYADRFVAIDFFRSLGQLTTHMANFWCRDATGTASPIVSGMLNGSQDWRTQYWGNLQSAITTKLNDWAYEHEYRIVLNSSLIDYRQKSSRKPTYRFDDLEGIIFGMRTLTTEKVEIIKVIQAKCKAAGRNSFSFYQANFSAMDGKMVISPLPLLRSI